MAAGADLKDAGRGTFAQFADAWLATIGPRKKRSTARMYGSVLRTHVYPRIGSVRLTTITIETIVSLVSDGAAAGVSWGTQKAIIRVVSACLHWAVRFRFLAANPCLQLVKDLKDTSYTEPEPNPLTPADASAFLTWVQTGAVPVSVDRPVDADRPRARGGQRRECWPDWFPYFATLLYTGMRRGEAAALKWTTVYLDSGRARLERSYSPSTRAAAGTGDGDVTLKGNKPHDIDLAPALVAVLRDVARIRNDGKLTRRPSPYVFVTARGARILSDSATAERVFARGMTALGLDYQRHTIHDLRDTFATMHLSQNPAKLYWVSSMLGHKQVTTTINRYTKYVPTQTGGQAFAGDLDLTPGRTVEGGTR
jgi:integrase